jgi:hypothetical protein
LFFFKYVVSYAYLHTLILSQYWYDNYIFDCFICTTSGCIMCINIMFVLKLIWLMNSNIVFWLSLKCVVSYVYLHALILNQYWYNNSIFDCFICATSGCIMCISMMFVLCQLMSIIIIVQFVFAKLFLHNIMKYFINFACIYMYDPTWYML